MPESITIAPSAAPRSPDRQGAYFPPDYFAAIYSGPYFAPEPEEPEPEPEVKEEFEAEIPGVTCLYGALHIAATKPGRNTALVEPFGKGGVKVTLNGRTVVFKEEVVGTISSVTYAADQRAQQGWDSFENRTNLTSSISMYGGHNTVICGTGWDFVMVTQGNNYVDAKTGGGMVYTFAGENDQIVSEDHVDIYKSDWDPYEFMKA